MIYRSEFFTFSELAVRLLPDSTGEGASLIPRHLTNGRVVAAPERMPMLPRHLYNAGRLLAVADELRRRVGLPIYVSSGSRIDQDGGQHPQLLAIDVVCEDYALMVLCARSMLDDGWPVHQFITYEGTTHIHVGVSGMRDGGGWYSAAREELRGRRSGRSWTYKRT